MRNFERTIYLTLGDIGDINKFIQEQNLEKNFVCLEREMSSINCSYIGEGVKFASRYTQSVRESAKSLVEIKLNHKFLYEELVILNGFASQIKHILEIKKLADLYFYKVVILFVDGEHFGNEPRNEKVMDFVKRGKYKFEYEVLSDLNSNIHNIVKRTDELIVDLNQYKRVFSFGDIHGCIEPILEFEKMNGFNDDEFYIFLGDYIDRGVDNVKLFQFVRDNIDKENFVFIIGNHEKSIYRHYINHLSNNTFTSLRYEEFIKAGFSDSEMLGMYDKMKMFFVGEFGGKKYFFNHGGLCDIPCRANLETGYVYTNGNKAFEAGVDEQFTVNQRSRDPQDRWIQFHGHRNNVDPYTYGYDEYSYSLEFGVEFGGHLGVVKIEKDEFLFDYIKNEKYAKKSKKGLT